MASIERAGDGHDQAGPDEDEADDWRPPPALKLTVALAALLVAGLIGFAIGSREPEPTAVDVGFLQDMVDHHEQALVMSKTLQTAGGSPEVLHFADEIAQTQSYELGQMLAWLEEWGRDRGGEGRMAMGWMGHEHPVQTMPGMASEAELATLLELEGRAADTLFVRLMIAHHRGGIEMADHAARHGSDPRVKRLAQRVSRYQAVEIREMEATRSRLGLPA